MNSEMFATRDLMSLLISQKCKSVKSKEQVVARGNVGESRSHFAIGPEREITRCPRSASREQRGARTHPHHQNGEVKPLPIVTRLVQRTKRSSFWPHLLHGSLSYTERNGVRECWPHWGCHLVEPQDTLQTQAEISLPNQRVAKDAGFARSVP